MGGMIVQVFLLTHPERVNALILMDTSYKIPDSVDPDMIAAGQAVVRDGGIELLVSIQDAVEGPNPLDTPAYLRMIAADPDYAAFSRRKTLATSSAGWVGLAGDMGAQADRLDALRDITVPTLVIVGEEDAGFMDQSRAMADAIPGATLAVIPDGGHSPQFEAPAAWWDAVSTFLATL
jgi:pimeloyl-ACP methyl ester carboxylesterase